MSHADPVRVQTEEAPINMRRLKRAGQIELADRLRCIHPDMPASWFLFDGAQINAFVAALDLANRGDP